MRSVLIGLVPLLAILAIIAVAGGATMPDSTSSVEELERLVGTDWYSVRIFGQPNGYARIETELLQSPEGPRLQVTEELRVLVSLGGQQLEASKSQITVYDDRLRPASIELVKNELGRASELTGRLEGNELVLRTVSAEPGAPPELVRRIDLPDDFASDVLISLYALRGQLKPGETFTYSVYDPEVDMVDTLSVSVAGREGVGEVQATLVEAASEKLGINVMSWIDVEGRLLRQSVPGLMDLSLERVSEQEALETMAPFEITNTIAVEQHLPLVRSLQEVRLRIARNVGSAAELIPATARQTIVADGEDVLVTVARETPPADSLPLPIEGEGLAEFLRPTSFLQSADPKIAEKAREIVGDETSAWGAAQKLCAWVKTNMQSVSSEPRPITALEILEAMRGDCTEHAILMAALGRAVGLPTKLVTGLAYVGGKFGYHAWTEVYVGRWVEMDPAWGEMTVDAGHLQVHSGSVDEQSFAQASLATGRTLGAISIEIEGYTTSDGRRVEAGEEEQ